MSTRTIFRHILCASPLTLLGLSACFDFNLGGIGGSTDLNDIPHSHSCPPISTSGTSGGPLDLCASGGLPESGCTPSAAECRTSTSRCLSMVGPTKGPVFGLRMSQITVTQPASIAEGLVPTLVSALSLPDRPACGIAGEGTLSWLLRFDLESRTLKTGGAAPPVNPAKGYAFFEGTIEDQGKAHPIKPATLALDAAASCGFTTSAADLTIPMFTNAEGTKVVLVPLHQVSLAGSLSGDLLCIGVFDPVSLERDCCVGTLENPPFREGGVAAGFFVLEEADTVSTGIAEASLCVVLSGNATEYGDGASPFARCKRDEQGHILFKGDWCAATNAPATDECADALRFSAKFAASGVPLAD
ncbi:MAG: hypothetical protein U0359_39845 [Byssovorax sp.]